MKKNNALLDRHLGKHAPLYQVLREEIRLQIYNGQLGRGERIATEAELAALHGVSNITVRRAMQELVNEGLLVRVAGRGTFVNASPFTATYNLLFVHRLDISFEHPYTGLMFKGINEVNQPTTRFRLETLGLPMPGADHPSDRHILDLVEHDQIHGVLAMPFIRPDVLSALKERVPTILLGSPVSPPAEMAAIRFPHQQEVLPDLLTHLLATGRRRIGCVTARQLQPGVHPFAEVFQKHGLDADPTWVQQAGWGIQGGCQAAEALLSRCPKIDAIVASDDIQALGVMHALWRRGLQPGREVAVTGIGNLLEEHSNVGLTTVDLQIRQGAHRGAQLLLELLEGKGKPRVVSIPSQLIVRETA